MNVASLPLVRRELDDVVRRIGEHYFFQAGNGQSLLAGNAEIMQATLGLIDKVVHVFSHGSDRHGLAPQTLDYFHVEPGKRISLWVCDYRLIDCRIPVTPRWLRRMVPVIGIALYEALEDPEAERLYRADDGPRGWTRIRTAVECGSD